MFLDRWKANPQETPRMTIALERKKLVEQRRKNAKSQLENGRESSGKMDGKHRLKDDFTKKQGMKKSQEMVR